MRARARVCVCVSRRRTYRRFEAANVVVVVIR